MEPIQIKAFDGMDNVSGGGFIGSGVMKPALIVNAVPDESGKLIERAGTTAHITLANAHSFFYGENAILCAGGASHALYLIDLDAETATSLGSITGGYSPLYYVEIGGCIYISNENWCKVYEAGALRAWGQIVTDMEALTWVLETNGSRYFLADQAGNPSATLKPHDFVHVPTPMKYITFAHGRIIGAREKVAYYSDAESVEWFQDDVNRLEFKDDILLIAASPGGVYFGFEKYTVFAGGTDFEEGLRYLTINQTCLGQKTLQYTKEFGEIPINTPVWGTDNGFVAGLSDGTLVELDKGQLRYDRDTAIGSHFRVVEGRPQYLATIIQAPTVVNADQITHDWVEDIYDLSLEGTATFELTSTGILST